MSFGGNKGHKSSQSTSSGTQTQTIDPAITQALQQNLARAQTVLGGSQYHPLSADQIQSYENPYTQDTINATLADIQRQGDIAGQQQNQQATAAGAFGGSRSAVLSSLNDENTKRIQALTAANLRNQGFQQAAQLADTQNAAANQYPLLIQQLLNQTTGLSAANANRTVTDNTKSSGTEKASGFGLKFQIPGFNSNSGGGRSGNQDNAFYS